MSNIIIKIVDTQHPDDMVSLEDLTEIGLGVLIFQCNQLLEKLRDAEAAIQE